MSMIPPHWVLLNEDHKKAFSRLGAEMLGCWCPLPYDHDEEGLEVQIAGQ